MILDEIIHTKHIKFARESYLYNIVKLVEKREMKDTVNFSRILEQDGLTIIGEIKKASPFFSKNEKDFDMNRMVSILNENSHAISVIAEEHFYKGNVELVEKAKSLSNLPILFRDFIVSPMQVFQAKSLGASAVFIVEHILKSIELNEYVRIITQLKMDPIVEIQSLQGLEKAIKSGAKIILINTVAYDKYEQNNEDILLIGKEIPRGIQILCNCTEYNDRVRHYLSEINADGIIVDAEYIKDIEKDLPAMMTHF